MPRRPQALVVEPPSPFRDSVTEFLRSLGWDVTTADDAAGGLLALFSDAAKWSLLFCDSAFCDTDIHGRFAQSKPGCKIVVTDGPPGAFNALSVVDQLVMPDQRRAANFARITLDAAINEAASQGSYVPLRSIAKLYAERVLAHTKGKKKEAAAILNIDRKTLDRLVGTKGCPAGSADTE